MSDKHGQELEKVDGSLLPHLESWERMMKLPVVEAAWTQSHNVYDKVRGEFSRKQVNPFKISYQFQLTSFHRDDTI